MKKLLPTLALLLCLTGCDVGPAPASLYPHEPHRDTIVIEGCEYLECKGGNHTTSTYSLTHKGNCNNPIHQARP